MKRRAFLVGLVLLVFAASIWAQAQAPKPDPEIRKFDVFLGHWTYAADYKAGPLGPASKSTGDMTIKSILKGFFFQSQAREKGPMGESQIMEIVGYDPAGKKFTSNEFHDDGSVFFGTYAVNGNTWTYSGKLAVEGKTILIKVVVTIAADRMSVTAKGELSTDGNTWVPWMENKYTKVTPAPKTK